MFLSEEVKSEILELCELLEPYVLRGDLAFSLDTDKKRHSICSKINHDLLDTLIADQSQLCLSCLHQWIFLIILLAHPHANLLWLHYRAMLLVREAEVPCKMLWISFHAKSVILRLSEGEEAAAVSFKILSEICLSVSPREASEFLYQAAQAGVNSADMGSAIKRLAVALSPENEVSIWNAKDQDNLALARCTWIVKNFYSHVFQELTLPICATDSLDSKDNILSVNRMLPDFSNGLPLNTFAYRYLQLASENGPSLSSMRTWAIDDAYLSLKRNSKYSISFYVFDSGKRFLADLSNGLVPFLDEKCTDLDRDCFFISDRFSHSVNICHFLYDEMIRLLSIEHALDRSEAVEPSSPLVFLVPVTSWSEKCLSVVRPDLEVLRLADTRSVTYRVKRLMISSDSSSTHLHPSGYFGAPLYLSLLRKLQIRLKSSIPLGDRSITAENKILILRDDSTTRRFANQDAVISFFTKYGFEAITIGSLNFDEQAKLFAQSAVVAAVHGQALANMIFMPIGASIIEFLPSAFGTHAYGMIASALGYNYKFLECRSVNGRDDVLVDMKILGAVMESLFS